MKRGGSPPDSVRWDGGAIDEDRCYTWVCGHNDEHHFHWPDSQTADGTHRWGVLTFEQTLAALEARGIALQECGLSTDDDVVIVRSDEQGKVLLASIKEHKPALLALATATGDAAGSDQLTCARCSADAYRFTPRGEATCPQHFDIAMGEWFAVRVIACRHCGSPAHYSGATRTTPCWGVYQCTRNPGHTTAVADQAEAQAWGSVSKGRQQLSLEEVIEAVAA